MRSIVEKSSYYLLSSFIIEMFLKEACAEKTRMIRRLKNGKESEKQEHCPRKRFLFSLSAL
jgi:hypothetical protein